MNRSARSHRSTKIPNVKLRPSRHSDSNAKRKASWNPSQDDQDDDQHFRNLRDIGIDHGAHMDADFIGDTAKPLKGAVISMTGIADAKVTLSKYATELGARVEVHLTEDVTHLVAERPGSEKYQCALELGMYIVKPDWITQIRDQWLEGQDVDPDSLLHRYSLQPLEGTTVAFAGLTGPDRRSAKKLASQLGATAADELRFDGSITHLVSATADPKQSQSIHYVLQFQNRWKNNSTGTKEEAAANIKIVRPEWLVDCQKASGCLHEHKYSVFEPLIDGQTRSHLIQQAIRKVSSPFQRELTKPATTQPNKKLKLVSQLHGSSSISISSSSSSPHVSFESRSSNLHLGAHAAPNKPREKQREEEGEEEEQIITLAPRHTVSKVISQLISTNRNDLERDTFGSKQLSQPRTHLLSMSRASSFSQIPTSKSSFALEKQIKTSDQPSKPEVERLNGCFSGITVRIEIQDPGRTSVLKLALTQAGAKVVTADDPTPARFSIVNSASASTITTHTSCQDPDQRLLPSDRGKLVTHYWIEYCIYLERLIQPDDYFASYPAQTTLPLVEGQKLRILLVGFSDDTPEKYHARKLIEELGGITVEKFKKNTITHILCANQESSQGQRCLKARSLGVPVVGFEFLETARNHGLIEPPPIPISTFERSASSRTGDSSFDSQNHSAGLAASMTPELSNVRSSSTAPTSLMRSDTTDEAGSIKTLALQGCTIACSRSIASGWAAIEKKAAQLGAEFQQHPDSTTTHLIHKGTAASRDTRGVRADTFLVHPSWLDKCLEESLRVDERLFPSSLNPSKSLDTMLSATDASAISRLGSQAAESSQKSLIAAAKPWHRSLSAGTQDPSLTMSSCSFSSSYHDQVREESGPPTSSDAVEPRLTRGRSESLAPVGNLDAMEDDDDDVSRDVQDEPLEAEPSNDPARETGADQGRRETTKELENATADQVVALLKSRGLDQVIRTKTRLAPRARKRRSNEFPLTTRDSRIARTNSGSTGLPLSAEAVSTAEKILAKQAEEDTRRAEQAAAMGFSLGLERESHWPTDSQSHMFDASLRIVYDDPAARSERKKLLTLVNQRSSSVDVQGDPEARPSRSGNGKKTEPSAYEPEGKERDQFGRGFQCSHSNMETKPNQEKKLLEEHPDLINHPEHGNQRKPSRKNESPTKRPMARRQPQSRR